MLSEAKGKFDMMVTTTFYGLFSLYHTLWKFYHRRRWFVLVKKMPSDEGCGEVSKIKVTKWLIDPKERDRSGINDWDITTSAIVKKKRRNKVMGVESERCFLFPFFFM